MSIFAGERWVICRHRYNRGHTNFICGRRYNRGHRWYIASGRVICGQDINITMKFSMTDHHF